MRERAAIEGHQPARRPGAGSLRAIVFRAGGIARHQWGVQLVRGAQCWAVGALALMLPSAPCHAQAIEAASEAAGTVTLADVDVAIANAPVGPAPRTHHAAQAPGTGLALYYAPGEAIDAAFVRKQFERN